MVRQILFTITFAALHAAAQSNPPVYVNAYYTKWLPGMEQQGRKFLTEVANKVTVARNRAGGTHIGQVRLYRVFPTGEEAGHDILRLVFHSSPPDLGVSGTPAAQLAATGLSPAEFSKKLAEVNHTVKWEIWTNVFRHGSLSEGDFVRVSLNDPPKDLTSEYTAFAREYESGMAEQLVKSGRLKGYDLWRLLLTPNGAPYNFASITVHKDSASVLSGLGNQSGVFEAAHPKGEYNRYYSRYRELQNTAKTVVYRVDSAIWK